MNTAAVLMYQAGRYGEGVRWMRMAEALVDERTAPFVVADFSRRPGHDRPARRRQRPGAGELLERSRAIFEQEQADGRLVIALCMSAYVWP